MAEPKWTWSDKEDDELYREGVTIMWVDGRTTAIQRFIEALSEKVDRKCDFSFTAGRAHIDVMPDVADKAREIITDKAFMEQFIVPYSDETYANGTYFNVLQ